MKNLILIISTFLSSATLWAQDAPSIFVDPNGLNYGTVKKGQDGLRQLQVTNQGSQPLIITNCTGSCGCTVPMCPKEPIMPKKSAYINVRYDTNRPGPFNKMITITSNDPNKQSIAVKVYGEVRE